MSSSPVSRSTSRSSQRASGRATPTLQTPGDDVHRLTALPRVATLRATSAKEREVRSKEYQAKAYSETATILRKVNVERENVKASMLDERQRFEELQKMKKTHTRRNWTKRLQNSPFLVDLNAESERIDEEHRVRLQEEARKVKELEAKKEKVKTEIILRALAEENEIQRLREEKRLLAEEEKRLKALKAQEKKRGKELHKLRMEQKKRETMERNCRAQKVFDNAKAQQLRREAERRQALVQRLELKTGLGLDLSKYAVDDNNDGPKTR
uniref:Uncharacterized protein n=1 Tax=Palpitomonas bilix TaxID=652834 RepID=A0A7S3CZ70_9EUKA|mmetsp:Transcript_1555/g.3142  ORF Transcript_1555/g.3142 Transcript_1555/m.3142 type:complete len:269 (+) Transcript_1555:307-1113(+)